MKKVKKMILCIPIQLVIVALTIHNAQGYSSLPALKNYNENVTKENGHIKRIIAFGDSLTEGYLNGGRKFYPYSTKLEEKLNSYFNWTRFEVLNEGISGECAFTEMVTRLPKVLDRIGDRADLVIILGGTNDYNKLDCINRINVAHEVITLHKIVHKRGLRSVLVTIPECSKFNKKCDENRVRVNDKLRSYASKHKKNTLLCDLGKFMPLRNMSSFDRKIYWDDKVHPSKVGYDKIAALLFHTIRQWLMPPVVDINVPPSDDSKKVPDPDPVNKLNNHKKVTQKKKENRDKKLAKALVSETNPVVANTDSNNYETAASNQFSPANTQTITALPSVSSSTSTSSKAAEMALEVKDPQQSASNNIAPPLKVSKPHNKHKNKIKINVNNKSPNRLSATNAAVNAYSNSIDTANANSVKQADAPVKPNTPSVSTTTNTNAPPANTQSYNPPQTNNSNPYDLYFTNKNKTNNTPNNTSPPPVNPQANNANTPNQVQAYDNNAIANNDNNNTSLTPASTNSVANQNTEYYNNNNTNTNTEYYNSNNTNTNTNINVAPNQNVMLANQPNVNSGNQVNQLNTNAKNDPNVKLASTQPTTNTQNNTTGTQGDIGDLQRHFPEFNLNEKKRG